MGHKVDASFTDLRWQRRTLPELGATAATVVFFATTVTSRVLPAFSVPGVLTTARAVSSMMLTETSPAIA